MKNKLTTEQNISKKIKQAQEYWTSQYDRLASDLKFASGDQWQSEVKRARDEDFRPSMTVNIVKPKINKIVNPTRVNSMGMRVKLPNKEVATLLNDKLRSIEGRSRASEGYQVAFECAVTGGIGWVHVVLDYLNDETTDVEPRIKGVVNPTSVYLDPFSDEMDGSDAKWGFIMNYIDKDIAEDEYGEADSYGDGKSDGYGDGKSDGYGDGDGKITDLSMYEDWLVPDNSVPELIFYELKEVELERYFNADGSYVTEGDEDFDSSEISNSENTRKIRKKTLSCCKYVGGKKVEFTEFDCNYIPLIPVYGDRILTAGQSDIKFAGQVHCNKDLQLMFNFYKSSELELITNAPKNPWIAEESQLENHEDDWDESNTRPKAVLKYKSVVKGGTQVPAPFRADNQAQTQSVVQSSNQAIADMELTSGVSMTSMNQPNMGVESGLALLTKENNAEISTAQYVDNLSISIEQTCRVVLNMLSYASDVTREEGFVTENGDMYNIEASFKEILTPKMMSQLDVSVSGGSSYEGRRKEAMASMMALGQLHPQGIGIVADLIAGNMDHPISDVASDRFKQVLPPEVKATEDGQQPPDPRATALLQQAQQQMDEMQIQMQQMVEQSNYYKGLAEQLNVQLVDNQKDREVDLMEKQMDSETKLSLERMKQEGASGRELFKIQADQVKQNKEIMSKALDDDQVINRTPAEELVPRMSGEVTPVNPDVIDEVDFDVNTGEASTGDTNVIDEVSF